MTPTEFLTAVLPSAGHGFYCACELSKKKEHVFVDEIAQLQAPVDAWGAKDIYFALATFVASGSRTAENAAHIRALFLDLDGYETKKAAAEALYAFTARTGLDAFSPYIVSSGGGIHVYWPFTTECDTTSWKPVAENLKRLCAQEGLRIDNTVTADAARVLRYPGTFNHKKKYKTPQPVKLLMEGEQCDFKDISSVINAKLAPEAAYKAPAKPVELEGVRPNRKPGASGIKLLQNTDTSFETIWLKSEAGTGCAQLTNYVDKATEDGFEPTWRGLLSWAKCCSDGPDFAMWLTELHPYPVERMQQKLAEIKGPYPCLKMDGEMPGICTKCPHWGKITNPLALGREVQTSSEPVPVAAYDKPPEPAEEAPEFPTEVAGERMRPKAPFGFSFGKTGGVYRLVEEKDAEGKRITQNRQILPYDMFVTDILCVDGEHLAHMLAAHPHGKLIFDLPLRALGGKDEVIKLLSSHNIISSFGKGNDQNLFDYVRSCVEEASLQRRAMRVPTQYGWQEDETFVFNGRVFAANGTSCAVPMNGLENLTHSTQIHGTLDGWRRGWNVLAKKKMHTLLGFALASFGAPLMRYTGQDGFVWHIASRESGTGKTLTLTAEGSVWGAPKRFRTGKGTSQVAMQQRLGLLNSLPLLVDEITSKARADLEWAPSFIFDITEGQGKERMESGANKERVNNTRWSTMVLMTANESLVGYMQGGRKVSSNGEIMRLLEWNPSEVLVFTPDEKREIDCLHTNYGVAGEAWVKWLVANQPTAKEVTLKIHKWLVKRMGFTDAERFWHAGVTSNIAAGVLLGDKYAGIINLPMEGIIDALLAVIEKTRYGIRRNVRTAEDVFNEYIRDHYGKILIVKKTGKSWELLGTNSRGVVVTFNRDTILGRIEHGGAQPGFVEVYIEETLMKKHCVALSFSYADMCAAMGKVANVDFVRKDLLAGTDGPTMRVNCLHISRKAEDFNEVPLAPPEAG